MLKSDSIVNLAKALVAAQGEFANVKKDADNPYFKSKYADLAGYFDTARPSWRSMGWQFHSSPASISTRAPFF